MKKIVALLLIVSSTTFGQVGIGTTTPDASAALDINSSSAGILIPRMSEAERTGIVSPAEGLLVYQTDNTAGFWFFNGSVWGNLAGGGGSGEFQSVSGVVQNTTNIGADDFVFGATTLDGSGNKFFYDKSNAAFRAGQASSTEWDNSNIGFASIGLGSDATASGDYSLAGAFGTASGTAAIAFNGTASEANAIAFNGNAEAVNSLAMVGGGVTAGSDGGIAIGAGARSEDTDAVALGENATATGDGAIALGNQASASGTNATALSNGIASGDSALAGVFGTASGTAAIAFNGTASEANAIAFNGNAEAVNSLAMVGGGVTAGSDGGIAIGAGSRSEATDAVALGEDTTASGAGAIALGFQAEASGMNATALSNGITSGDNSIAGAFGVASGAGSIALGGIAEGVSSIALGDETRAYSYGEIVVGYESANYTPSSTTLAVSSDRLFVVANASTTNALTMLKDGKTGISRIPTTNILEVNGNASKSAAGDWLANSDRRLKKNINTFSEEKALENLLRLRGVMYEWNDPVTGNERPKGIQYGFIAQEIEEVFPENVSLDNQGYYQTAYGTYDALYVQSIKALNTKIDVLSKENEQLKLELQKIYTLLEDLHASETKRVGN